MHKEIKKAIMGIVIVLATVLLISLIIPHKAGASEMDSTDRNPGLDKVTELGTAIQMWAIGFGADVEKSAVETKKAFLDDIEKVRQSEFWQYQVNGWEEGKQDLAKTKEQIGNLLLSMGQVLNKVMGGSDAR